MTGSSINFAPVHSAQSAVSHADRSVAPSYLLSPDRSLGTICVLDDHGKVAQTLDAKMALASRQARAAKNFSPLWEGVLNLPRPDLEDPKFDVAAYKKHCVNVTNKWVDVYEKATSHKVLRVDIHLDEGRVEDGITLLNAHAHIISDKTNERGKVHIINRKEMRVLQDMTAEVTQLERGQSSKITRRKHLNPSAFKAVKKEHEVDLKELEARLTEQYKADREAMKASGEATQKQYKELKIAHEQALTTLAREIKLTTHNIKEARSAKAKIVDLKAHIDGEPERLRLALVAEKYRLDREEFKRLNAEALAAGLDKPKSQKDYSDLKKAYEQLLIEKAPATPTIQSRFAEMAAQARAQRANPPTPSTRGGETAAAPSEKAKQPLVMGLHPIPQVIGPNARAGIRAEQEAKAALEAPKQQEQPIAPTTPEKTLTERLNESFMAFMAWINGEGGKVESLQDGKNYCGRVVQLDDLHCVQRVGGGKFAIHALDKLDIDPDLDNPKTEIHYSGGFGKVLGNGAEQHKYPTPGGR